MIPNNIRRKIIDEINIVEVVGEYVKLTKKGNSNFGLCPFHDDKHPSMSVSNNVKMFNCFSCGVKGNVINFVSRIENISEDDACRKLAKRIDLKINERVNQVDLRIEKLEKLMDEASKFYTFYLLNSEEGSKALEYLAKRGITEDIINKFKIGLAPAVGDSLYKFMTGKGYLELDLIETGLCSTNESKTYDVFKNRIMFSITNKRGHTVAFSGRIFNVSDQTKYINSKDNVLFHKGEVLYNYYNASLPAQKQNAIYIFEGFMDVIAAYKAGIENGVATMGTALTQEHLKNIFSLTKNVILCFDGDEAGIHAMNRGASMLAVHNLIPEALVIPDNQDPDEYLKKYGENALKEYLTTKKRPVYSWLYDLAYQKLIKLDMQSIENFKNTVYEFINFSVSSTVQEFYLNKMATDLNISIEKIRTDYENYSNNKAAIARVTPHAKDDEHNDVLEVNSSYKQRQIKIPKSVILSYRVVIGYSLRNGKYLNQYYQETAGAIIDKSLVFETAVMAAIKEIYDEYPDLYEHADASEFILEKLCDVAEFSNFLQEIHEDKKIILNDNKFFYDCLDKIKKLIKTSKENKAYNIAQSGGIAEKEAYLKIRKDNIENN